MDDRDEIDELARVLRSRVGSDFRAEAEEGERLAELAALRARTLGDVAADLRAEGALVQVAVAGRSLTGLVVRSGHDFLEIDAPGGAAIANLTVEVSVRVLGERAIPDDPPGPGAVTLRGRLLELELDAVDVELVARAGESWTGRLRAVGRDHVVLVDRDGEVVVPIVGLALVLVR